MAVPTKKAAKKRSISQIARSKKLQESHYNGDLVFKDLIKSEKTHLKKLARSGVLSR